MIRHLELKAYGKINLGLDVVRRREDGYHEVRMIMQTVRVYDAIELNRTEEEGIRLSTNLYYLPDNENNLGYRAAKLLMDEFGIRDGVEIKMKKFIPVAAGMAGGSSDAAAVLFGLNKMFGLGLSKKELMERGVRLGADVPYCIMRGTALSEGIGEIMTPLPPMPQCRVLIAKPAVSVSTKHVYESLNLPSLGAEAHPDIDAMRAAIEKKDLSGVVSQLGNVLETVTIPENPVIQTLKDKMMEMGADGSLMSGSGPTVFGLFTNQTAAQAAYEELRYGSSQDLAKQVYLTSFTTGRGTQMGNNFEVKMNEYLPLRDVVFNTLRQAILKGELAPGERLMEIQLAQKLGVSRTPIREAIRKLELEGLVLMIPRRGAEVARISEKSLKDVLEVRRSLEELAIELACQRMTEEDMQALEEAQKAFKAAIDQGDAMKIAETDEAYHDVIYHSTRNKRLVQILNNLREQMYRFRLEYIKDEDKRQILQLEHEKILAALRLRHMAEAKAVARGHIDNQEITVLKNLKERKEV